MITKKVFISGASSGIGAALAKCYALQGAQLGITGRNQEKLKSVANTIVGDCSTYVADVRDASAMQQVCQEFIGQYGSPDIVIANAGVSRGTLTEYKEDIPPFGIILETNVLGLLHTFHPFIQTMKQNKSGSLVGIASIAGIRGLPGASAYCASKAAAISYLESLRVELMESGINVTTICPGYIKTPMTDVNTHKMPFIMDADDAARRIVKIIAKKRRYAITPWQMSLVGRLMKLVPAAVWDQIMKKAPHKPRFNWDWL